MLMALGQFVFGLPTLAYQDFKRQTQWRHPSSSRVGARAAHQYVGPGDDSITLSGVLSPELVGRAASIRELREMGETGTLHLDNGMARRIEFDLQLKRVDDQRSGAAVNVGTLGDFQAGGA